MSMFTTDPQLIKVAEERLSSATPNMLWTPRTKGAIVEAIEELTELAKISPFYEKLLELAIMCPDAEIQDATLRALQKIVAEDADRAEVLCDKCVALTHKAVESKPEIREMAGRILSGLSKDRFQKELPRLLEDQEIAGSMRNCSDKLLAA